ncbi:MAG: AAA family ATPase [Nanoarchaeota archaeon]|nr:AAA family ATPase [Nanoarchaeota archaeon]
MSLFKDILSSEESVFKNEVALDFSFQPKIVPYRESQQRVIADCIKPLCVKRNGKNILIHGPPGVGKTVAIKQVLKELGEEIDDVQILYVNCWQKNTTFKIFVHLCEQLEYPHTQNKGSEELFKVVKNVVNKESAVFVFDEVDKVEDMDFLYSILEEVFRKSIILITNYPSWLQKLEQRIVSRINLQQLAFEHYTLPETKVILQQRLKYAFHEDAVEPGVLDLIAEKTFASKDMRVGVTLLREAGMLAEERASRTVAVEDVSKALESKLDLDSTASMADDLLILLELVKEYPGLKMGELFEQYTAGGGNAAYRTFARKINKLGDTGQVVLEKISGGADGSTTLVRLPAEKKLTEF